MYHLNEGYVCSCILKVGLSKEFFSISSEYPSYVVFWKPKISAFQFYLLQLLFETSIHTYKQYKIAIIL